MEKSRQPRQRWQRRGIFALVSSRPSPDAAEDPDTEELEQQPDDD